MLREMSEHDLTAANLYMKAILEEVKDVAMLEEALQPDMFERLRELSSFREYEAKVKAEGKAEAEAEAAEKAQAATDAAIEKARADSKVEDLIRYLVLRGDPPSSDAIKQISACQDASVLGVWLMRAYQGEKAADIFAEPQRDPRG